ncbi:hypothetical protein A2U01_0062197, partial [Trifolium medium]|nr:hypothetical protein [Trifolium medium]
LKSHHMISYLWHAIVLEYHSLLLYKGMQKVKGVEEATSRNHEDQQATLRNHEV